MTKTISALLFATLLGAPTMLWAGGRSDAIWGGALGGAFGAAIGSEMGGRDGAIVGGAIGGATGAALATQRDRRYHSEGPGYYRYHRAYSPRDYGPPPSYYYRHSRDRGYHRHYRDWE